MSTAIERENAELKRRVDAMAARLATLTAELPRQERDELSAAQARADSCMAQFGQKALPPLASETSLQYRRRLLAAIQKHSPTYKDVDVSRLDYSSIGPIENGILAEARAKAADPDSYRPGELRAIEERDASGRMVTRFVGDSLAWMSHFMTGSKIGRIKDPRK